MTRIFDLTPDTMQKSFYGKAKVIDDGNGNLILISYDTKILQYNTNTKELKIITEHESDFTATTVKHCKAFLNAFTDYVNYTKQKLIKLMK